MAPKGSKSAGKKKKVDLSYTPDFHEEHKWFPTAGWEALLSQHEVPDEDPATTQADDDEASTLTCGDLTNWILESYLVGSTKKASASEKKAAAQATVAKITDRIHSYDSYNAKNAFPITSVRAALNDCCHDEDGFPVIEKTKQKKKAASSAAPNSAAPNAAASSAGTPKRAYTQRKQAGTLAAEKTFGLANDANQARWTFTESDEDKWKSNGPGSTNKKGGIDYNKMHEAGIVVYHADIDIQTVADLPPKRSFPDDRLICEIEKLRYENLAKFGFDFTSTNYGATYNSRNLPVMWRPHLGHPALELYRGELRYVAFTNGEAFYLLCGATAAKTLAQDLLSEKLWTPKITLQKMSTTPPKEFSRFRASSTKVPWLMIDTETEVINDDVKDWKDKTYRFRTLDDFSTNAVRIKKEVASDHETSLHEDDDEGTASKVVKRKANNTHESKKQRRIEVSPPPTPANNGTSSNRDVSPFPIEIDAKVMQHLALAHQRFTDAEEKNMDLAQEMADAISNVIKPVERRLRSYEKYYSKKRAAPNSGQSKCALPQISSKSDDLEGSDDFYTSASNLLVTKPFAKDSSSALKPTKPHEGMNTHEVSMPAQQQRLEHNRTDTPTASTNDGADSEVPEAGNFDHEYNQSDYARTGTSGHDLFSDDLVADDLYD